MTERVAHPNRLLFSPITLTPPAIPSTIVPKDIVLADQLYRTVKFVEVVIGGYRCCHRTRRLVLIAGDTTALVLTPFRYQDQAQRHCPADTVVWLDFKEGKYYLGGQKLYGHGFHGSYVCLQEARRSLYRRSQLGWR